MQRLIAIGACALTWQTAGAQTKQALPPPVRAALDAAASKPAASGSASVPTPPEIHTKPAGKVDVPKPKAAAERTVHVDQRPGRKTEHAPAASPATIAVPKIAAAEPGIPPIAMPRDARLVVFPYDPNYTYPLISRVNLFTRIALSPGEKVIGFYISDQLKWTYKISKNRASVLVMPYFEGTFNSASLETTKRTYELTFTSVAEPENWYQRVSWHFPAAIDADDDAPDGKSLPDVDVFEEAKKGDHRQNAPQTTTPTAPPVADAASDGVVVDLANANFNFAIEGSAPFKPTMVFDDGKNTWFKLPRGSDAPTFFLIEKDGTARPVEVAPHGEYVVMAHPVKFAVMLKLGKEEVRVKNKNADCGFFGGDCWRGRGASNINQ